MVWVRNLFRLRLEAPESLQHQLSTFLDAGEEQEDTRLAVLAEWHDRALRSALEPILFDFARADREARMPAGAFLEDLLQALESARSPLAIQPHTFELGIVLCAGRSLYVLHSPGLQPQLSLGGPPQPLQSTLRVRVKELPLPGAPEGHNALASRFRLVRVFFEDEDRAVLWLGSGATAGSAAALALPGEDPAPAPATARIVLLKDPEGDAAEVTPAADAWSEGESAPGRDRVRMSYAALILVVAVFAVALFGMSRWHRMAERRAADGVDGLLTQGVDSSLEPSPPARVSGEVVERDEAPASPEAEVAHVPPAAGDAAETPLQLLWSKRHRDWVTSSPRWAQGRVVYGCRDGHVYAVDEGGTPVWEYDSGSGVGATPEVDGTRLFCGNYAGRAFALRALDGQELWAHDLGSRIVATPAVGHNQVFFQTYAGDVLALEQKNGRLAWKRQIGGQLRARPLVTKRGVLVVSGSGDMLCLDQKTGEPRWTVALGGRVLSNPLLADDIIVMGSHDGRVLALRLEDGRVAWSARTGGAVDSSPAACGEQRVVVGCADGHVYAFERRDGRVAWRFRARGPILSAPCVEENRVYVTAYDRNTYVLDAESGELVGKTALKAPIYSSPLVHEGRIYFGSNDGTFYCLSAAR